MTAVELFGRLPASASDAIFSDLLSSDKPGYKALTQSLATRRKLRPVFVDRKLRPDRHVWIAGELHRASNADLAEHVLQTWILTTHRELVCAFLDALEIPHDGKGMLDTLPAEPPVEAQRAAVETLLASYPRDAVIVYLHLFNSMDIAGWQGLRGLLEGDSRLDPAAEAPLISP